MSVTTRHRLRHVIADYSHAADTDGEHFAAAADTLAVILRTHTTRAELLDAITAAIDETHDVAVLSLLHNARSRAAGDLVDIGRQANDAVNARTTAHGRTA